MDPVTLLIASTAMSAVGAISQGQQSKRAAQAQAQASEYNAAMSRAQAEHVNAQTGVREDEQRRQARAAIGMQVASSAGAGAGLNSDLLRESIFNMDTDTGVIRYEGRLKAAGLNDQAALDTASASNSRAQGKAAATAGYFNAAGSLLNGAASYSAMGAPNAFADRAGPSGSGSGGRTRTITGGR